MSRPFEYKEFVLTVCVTHEVSRIAGSSHGVGIA